MNGQDQQNEKTGDHGTMIGNEQAFNFKNEQLNRFIKLFNSKITFTYGERQVSAEVFQVKSVGNNEVEIACRDSDLRYDVILNLKNRHARVARVYPLRSAIQV